MNPSKTGVLVPPRPNPGPEPWTETRPWSADFPILGWIVAVAIVIIGFGRRLRWLRARSRHPSRTSGSTAAPGGAPPSRRERQIALSRELREALAARFGPAWLSKTTEEIAHETALAEAFGPEVTARLIRFLQEADRAKFADLDAGEPPSTLRPDHGEDWVEEFLGAEGPHAERSRRETGADERPPPGR